MLHQVELRSADPVQLNGRGYTMDNSDWSGHARPTGQLQWRHTHTQYLQNNPVPNGSNLFKF